VLELRRAGNPRVLAVIGPDRLDRNFQRPSKPCLVWSRSTFALVRTAKEIVGRIDRAIRNAISGPNS
jgi:hypothetical protein